MIWAEVATSKSMSDSTVRGSESADFGSSRTTGMRRVTGATLVGLLVPCLLGVLPQF